MPPRVLELTKIQMLGTMAYKRSYKSKIKIKITLLVMHTCIHTKFVLRF